MHDELKHIENAAETEIRAAKTLDELEERRIQFLGRERGALTLILRQLKNLAPAERANVGNEANRLREKVERLIDEHAAVLRSSARESILERERIDVSRPGKRPPRGHLHPLTKLIREIEQIFLSLGFAVAEGPDVETEWYNFDALNIPAHHPARDMWDTFWLRQKIPSTKHQDPNKSKIKNLETPRLLLRTHTSPVQVRYMEKHQPPLRIIAPGVVYRYEATDVTHEIQFHQLEGLMVDRDISIANFRYVIEQFFTRLFGKAMEVRLRPSYFPFTEPSFEVDMRAKGSKGAWLEISGAGMVHPNVFKAAGLNPKQWQGFAFGMGIERLALLKWKIPDVRLFHSGDIRFLKQF
ncbi:phenylalanine--tRNA ligase subunit alpha [Candidatus Parcubacteria bacterium]|nr:MAG: phenylalanine--tRNA ligase subunit alpha [Candidatus Parcubacteria bacterium]